MNLANKLTLFRIILIPLIVLIELFPYSHFNIVIPYLRVDFVILSWKNIAVLTLFCIASITDFLDGYIARKHQMITSVGKFLDPIADKLLVNSLFIIFAYQGLVPVIAVLVMVWRDTVVDAVRMMLSRKGMVMAAGYLGKIKTVAQMLAIIFVLLNNLPFELFLLPISSILVWFATLISVFSGASYVLQSRRFFEEE